MTRTENQTDRIHLQGIGNVPAVAAADIQLGDTLTWNYGEETTVVAIEEASAKFLSITERARNGKEYTRKLRKDRLVARS